MLIPSELLKHTSVGEPVVWSGAHESQVQIDSSVSVPRGETECTLWIV